MNDTVILCGCEERGKIDANLLSQLRQALESQELACTYVSDLCGLAARNPKAVSNAVGAGAAVLACNPRAVSWLLEYAGVSREAADLSYVDITGSFCPQDVASSLSAATGPLTELKYCDTWTPWFPVIDRDRCNGCGKCLSFCLFGVYGADKGNVRVTSPANCKNNCPACARVCPQGAIMFPKSDEGAINGAQPADGAGASEELQQIMTGNVYAALAARKAKTRSSVLRKRQLEQEAEERAFCTDPADCNCACSCSDSDDSDSDDNSPGCGSDESAGSESGCSCSE